MVGGAGTTWSEHMFIRGRRQRRSRPSRTGGRSVDNAVDDDDSTPMSRVALVFGVVVSALWSAGLLAHEGHAATPAHVHVASGVPVDVGAAIAGILAGTGAIAIIVRRQRR